MISILIISLHLKLFFLSLTCSIRGIVEFLDWILSLVFK